jgi:hypothetical protein
MNPWRTPERIYGRQLTDEGANVCGHARPAGALSALPRPEPAKPAAVPRDDGLRLDDADDRAPPAPCLREPRPQHSVGRCGTETWPAGAIHDGELVSQRDNLQVQRGA